MLTCLLACSTPKKSEENFCMKGFPAYSEENLYRLDSAHLLETNFLSIDNYIQDTLSIETIAISL